MSTIESGYMTGDIVYLFKSDVPAVKLNTEEFIRKIASNL